MKKFAFILLAASVAGSAWAEAPKKVDANAQFDQLFNSVDADHDGKLSKAEAALKAPAMGDAFSQIDTDHDGYLSKPEIKAFTAFILKSQQEFTARLNAADKDKSGQLSEDESKALPKLHDNFAAIDSNHDKQIVYKEITDFLRAQMDAKRVSKP